MSPEGIKEFDRLLKLEADEFLKKNPALKVLIKNKDSRVSEEYKAREGLTMKDIERYTREIFDENKEEWDRIQKHYNSLSPGQRVEFDKAVQAEAKLFTDFKEEHYLHLKQGIRKTLVL